MNTVNSFRSKNSVYQVKKMRFAESLLLLDLRQLFELGEIDQNCYKPQFSAYGSAITTLKNWAFNYF